MVETAVADLSLSNPHTYAACDSDKIAVAYFHIFARGMSPQSQFVAPGGHAVVPGFDMAVFDQNMSAAVDVDAVGIHHKGISPDGNVVNVDIFTAMEEAVPILSIFKADIPDFDIAAVADEDHLRHTPLGEFVMGMGAIQTHNVAGVKDRLVIAVDGAFA